MAYTLRSARYLAAEIRENLLQPGNVVIDATLGNGYDTCHLAELVGPQGHVYGFDIQQEAVERTRVRLEEQGYADRCTLFHSGHEAIADYVKEPVTMVIFNLGWLPGGDKTITTLWPTTKKAIESALSLIVPGGVCTICAYPGHAAGDEERENLVTWLSTLDNRTFNILHQRFLNAGAGAPECFVIQKNAD